MEQRETVDFGIDLGTTNSAIARATPNGVKIVKNRLQSEITPSVAARTRSGQTLIGQDALNKPDLSPAARFKRLMGTSNATTLADGSSWLPEELSAEVLKDLKASAQRRFDLQPTHAVITVPAMFQQPQCEATHRAASLAGLNAVSLLQEPIAAATAYLNDDGEEGYYLVYDLGGGTFDVSVVRVRDNEMTVLAHGGDNYLGGSDFDRRIADWVTGQLERAHGKLPELQQPSSQFLLLRECEEARKLLSDDQAAVLDLGDLGTPVSHMVMSRSILEDLIVDDVKRTVRLASERLQQAELRPQDIRRVLLVGGPTMTPFIRQTLKQELGIPLSFDQDPMTVVAAGAAITASALLIRDRAPRTEPKEGALLDLYYEPTSPETISTISGRITKPDGFTGEVRIGRASGDWDSGWIALRNGAFQSEVVLKPRAATDFVIALRDLTGTFQEVSPASVTIRHGLAAAVPVTPYDYGVALSGGAFDAIIPREQPLPVVGSYSNYRAAKTIRAGSAEELFIYFLEGSSPVAADNMAVGFLAIKGQDLTRTLKEGDKIEIRIRMDESRKIEARVSLPQQDMDYNVPLTSIIVKPQTEDLAESVVETRESVQNITALVEPEDEQRLRQSQRDIEIIEADMERLSEAGDIGAAERVMSKLMPVRAEMRSLETKYGLQSAHQKAVRMIDQAEAIADRFDDSIGVAAAADLREEADRRLRLQDEPALKSVYERASKIFWGHFLETHECWIGHVEWLREQKRFASEAAPYEEYLKRAESCLQDRDYSGVHLNGQQAASYLPESKARTNRFAESGIGR